MRPIIAGPCTLSLCNADCGARSYGWSSRSARSGLGTFVIYGASHGFSPFKILLNTLPFPLVFAVAYSLRRRRSIMYYLVVVDGLLLVKAICGGIAMRFF
ncbi:MAG: hypothetical protein IPH53_12425 [Flavobacteriales bacterium]|nr:hypothetical protein [Flavobacteriales bacterium]